MLIDPCSDRLFNTSSSIPLRTKQGPPTHVYHLFYCDLHLHHKVFQQTEQGAFSELTVLFKPTPDNIYAPYSPNDQELISWFGKLFKSVSTSQDFP